MGIGISVSISSDGTFTISSDNNSPKKLKNKRISKGKSVLDFPEDFTVIDLETTGLSPDYDEIIEIAAIRVRNLKVVDTLQTLVKPQRPIDEYITELTGITNEMVENAPPVSDALPKLLDFVSDNLILGHNVNFDVNFIYDECINNNLSPFSNDFVDTLRLSRKLHPDLQHHRLSDVMDYLHVSTDTHHRALADCYSTFRCFCLMREEAIAKYETVANFQKAFKSHYYGEKINARDITTQNTEFDTTHPIYGKTCVFTGTLERMSRKEAMQIVVDLGGICANGVTKETNYLILGNNDYCSTIKDGKSIKQKKAEAYKLKGLDIEIMPESVFYDMIQQ